MVHPKKSSIFNNSAKKQLFALCANITDIREEIIQWDILGGHGGGVTGMDKMNIF